MNYQGYPNYQQPAPYMPGQNPYAVQPQNQIPQASQKILCQLVTGIEEARAAQIPLDAICLFYNTATGEIYRRVFNSWDGSAPVVIYAPAQPMRQCPPQMEPAPVEYVGKEQFEELRQQLEALKAQVEEWSK